MPHPYFSYAAVAVGLMPGLLSISMLLNPEKAMKSAHFRIASQDDDRKVARSLMRIFAIRNVAVSYILTLNWYYTGGDQRLMGLGMFGALLMCTGDGFIVQNLTGGHGWDHWQVSVVVAVITSGLLGVFG